MPDPIGAALAVAEALPEGTEMIFMGGLAANAFRIVARLTEDTDLLIVADLRSTASIARTLVSRGFVYPPGKRVYRVGRFEWRRLLWPVPDHRDPSIVDLFFSGADRGSAGFISSVVVRAGKTAVAGRVVKVATPEDIIVFKALGLASGTRGPKAVTDEDDVRSILENPELSLDVGYIRKQASSIGVLRTVNKLLGEIGL